MRSYKLNINDRRRFPSDKISVALLSSARDGRGSAAFCPASSLKTSSSNRAKSQ
jgi:hypothetical protein